MPLAFLVAIRWGRGARLGLAAAFPVVPLAFLRARGPLGIDAARLGAAIAPGLGAAWSWRCRSIALAGARRMGPACARCCCSSPPAGWLLRDPLGVSRATLLELVALVVRRPHRG
jgi:hypothetical protein